MTPDWSLYSKYWFGIHVNFYNLYYLAIRILAGCSIYEVELFYFILALCNGADRGFSYGARGGGGVGTRERVEVRNLIFRIAPILLKPLYKIYT